MNRFLKYRKKAIQEMRPYVQDEDMTGISISQPDALNGSPRVGDMIARNPTDHNDQWLVSAKFFKDSYEQID